MINVREDIRGLFAREIEVGDFLDIECEVVRRFKNRITGRFERDGRAFYIKKHYRLGWRAILEEWLRLRKAQVGARSEWQAIKRLEALGVETMRIGAYGERGKVGAYQESFLITEELGQTISLEELFDDRHRGACDGVFKAQVIRKLADIARTLHENDVNHRDFYICHFLLDISGGLEAALRRVPKLYLIDLHRVGQRRRTPRRWIVKDLGSLYFSAMDAGLSVRDVLRFMKRYTGKGGRVTLREDGRFWRSVRDRAVRLYRKTFKRPPVMPEDW